MKFIFLKILCFIIEKMNCSAIVGFDFDNEGRILQPKKNIDYVMFQFVNFDFVPVDDNGRIKFK